MIYQAAILLAVGAVGFTVYHTTEVNLGLLNVKSGFEFLHHRAGFALAQSLIPYDEDASIARAFLVAALNTLFLAIVASAFATVLGILVGISRLSSNWLVAHLALAYVEVFRNIPVLLQVFFWYFVALRGLPSLAGSLHLGAGFVLNNRGLYFPTVTLAGGKFLFGALLAGLAAVWIIRRQFRRRLRPHSFASFVSWLPLLLPCLALLLPQVALRVQAPLPGRFEMRSAFVLMPEFLALAIALATYNASYIAEIVRSSFSAIPVGQQEAADALGLPAYARFRRVLLPQALVTMLPPLASVYMNLLKATSLAAAIAYPEIVSVFVGTVNNLVGQPVEIMGLTLIVYVLLALLLALAMNGYNRRLRSRGQQ